MTPEADSFLILEQKEPGNPENYWFIQCAVARQGPDTGKYVVEIGCPSSNGSCLWERMVLDVREAAKYFSDAYYHRTVDVSAFQEGKGLRRPQYARQTSQIENIILVGFMREAPTKSILISILGSSHPLWWE